MNFMRLMPGLCATAVVAAFLPAGIFADSHEARPGLAEVWVVTPKDGHTQAFEEALAAHLKFRENSDGGRVWKTYVPVIGDDLRPYIMRSCCFRWTEMDAHVDWERDSGAGAHWFEHVDEHVGSYAHYLSELDLKNSRWPEDDSAYTYFGVTRFTQRPGSGVGAARARGDLSQAAKKGGWGRYWSWSTYVGGSGDLFLASPYKSYAEMAPLAKSFPEFLAEQLGSEEKAGKALKAFSDAYETLDYTVYRRADELSMAD